MPGLAGQPQVLFERARQAQVDDVRPRHHDAPRRLLLEVEHVFDHDALGPRKVPSLRAFEQDVPQFFLGVSQLLGAGPAQAQHAQGQVAGRVQQPDHRPEDVGDQDQGRCGHERQDPRCANGQRLGGLFAQGHMQKCHQAERRQRNDADGEPRYQPRDVKADEPEEPTENRAQPAQTVLDHGHLPQDFKGRGNQRLDPVLDSCPTWPDRGRMGCSCGMRGACVASRSTTFRSWRISRSMRRIRSRSSS